ncbi:MAG: type 1 glutamine amidotransferase [Microbacteriaceae bacterium]
MSTRPEILVVVHDVDDHLNEMATPIAEAGIRMTTWDVQNDYDGIPSLDDLDRYSGIISLGAHAGVLEEGEHPWMQHERKIMQWALDTETPLLGLCFGSQLLASTAGGEIRKAEQGEFGWTAVTQTAEAASDPVVGAMGVQLDAFQFHFDTFDLPDSVTLLGTGGGMNQTFRVGPHAWGTQFHPEVGLSQQLTWLSTYRRAFVNQGIDIDEQIAKSHDLAASYRAQAWALSAAFAEQVLAFHQASQRNN